MSSKKPITSIGILGFGAFGRLIADHLHPHFELIINDPALVANGCLPAKSRVGDTAEVGRCDLVILAVPIDAIASATHKLRPHLRPGSIILDVTSVKVEPVKIMKQGLPPYVDIIGTHPLFGPQSARTGIAGRKIAICPVRGRSALRVAAFLRKMLGLKVYITRPEEHDKEAAMVQGITHLIAQVLVRMEPLPCQLTTNSFDLLVQATEMVRYDAESVFLAIENDNPYSTEMRQRFFGIADQIRAELETRERRSALSSIDA